MSAARLPGGVLVAWYGDDFTGSAAVMEALTFSGVPAVLFFNIPTEEQLARFPGYQGIGIAGIARSQSPQWMERELPRFFRALAKFEAAVNQYKICSTLDSSPETGSIGKAIELGAPILGGDWHPLLVAAPAMHRYQAFGNLFASVDGAAYRLDRHPTMSRHPVTPMQEADVRAHLARQTALEIGLVDLAALKSGDAREALEAERRRGARIVALDVIDDETLAAAGELVWEGRGSRVFAAASQGLEYALIAYWRKRGWLAAAEQTFRAAPADRIAVVSGSCSPVTARQIDWAAEHGFAPIRLDAAKAIDARAWAGATATAIEQALTALSEGRDPLVFTAGGPDDPAIATFRSAVEASGSDSRAVNARIGDGLGRILDQVLRRAGVRRAVIAGGDTSGHSAQAIGVYALTAVAPTVPGAALFQAHSEDPAYCGLELALKGGQMGGPDYFGHIKRGGGPL